MTLLFFIVCFRRLFRAPGERRAETPSFSRALMVLPRNYVSVDFPLSAFLKNCRYFPNCFFCPSTFSSRRFLATREGRSVSHRQRFHFKRRVSFAVSLLCGDYFFRLRRLFLVWPSRMSPTFAAPALGHTTLRIPPPPNFSCS